MDVQRCISPTRLRRLICIRILLLKCPIGASGRVCGKNQLDPTYRSKMTLRSMINDGKRLLLMRPLHRTKWEWRGDRDEERGRRRGSCVHTHAYGTAIERERGTDMAASKFAAFRVSFHPSLMQMMFSISLLVSQGERSTCFCYHQREKEWRRQESSTKKKMEKNCERWAKRERTQNYVQRSQWAAPQMDWSMKQKGLVVATSLFVA